ncbi:MAG: helicase-associated domain-containing protein [Candidatus Sabulitectum sp.]|nr:helicase-associated domain-containing protein [Candidatus Sabulitectum sp.]
MSYLPILDIVSKLDAEKIKKIARNLQVGRSFTRKADLIGAITHLIKTDIQAVLKHCSVEEKQVLALAAHKKGRVSAEMFSSRYGYGFPERLSHYSRKNVSPYQALVFNEGYQTTDLLISDELVEILKDVFPPPAAEVVKTTDEIPQKHKDRDIQIHYGESTVFSELKSVLRLVDLGKISVSEKTRKPSGTAVKAITNVLSVPDFQLEDPTIISDPYYESPGSVRAYAWGILVQSCGWSRYSKGKLKLSASGKKAMNGDFEEFVSGVWSYLDSSKFDELNRVKTIRGQTGKGKRGLTDLDFRKPNLLAAIHAWPVEEWISFKEVCRFQLASDNSFTVSENLWHLYFSEKQYGSLGYDGSEGELEKVYTRVFLFEYLATLGLIDVAYVYPHYLWPEFNGWWGSDNHPFCSRYDGLLYVKLNPLGAYCLDVSDSYTPPEIEERKFFRIQSNMELVVNDSSLTATELHSLEMFAEQTSDMVWKVSKENILLSIEQGSSIDELLEFIENHSENQLPNTLQVFLDDMGRKIKSILSVSDAVLVKCNDSVTAAAIASDSSLKKICQLAGDNSVVVGKKNEKAFRARLRKKGYILPK